MKGISNSSDVNSASSTFCKPAGIFSSYNPGLKGLGHGILGNSADFTKLHV